MGANGNDPAMLSKYGRQFLAVPVSALTDRLHSRGITPNGVTAAGFGLTLVSAAFLAMGYLRLGGVILMVASLFDLLDGSLARLTQQVSTFGAFLDSTLDRYSESLVLLVLAYYYTTLSDIDATFRIPVVLVVATLVGSFMVSYTRARAEGLHIDCKVGVLQRPERLFLLITGLIIGWTVPMLWILAFLTNVTALQRVYEVYKRTRQA